MSDDHDSRSFWNRLPDEKKLLTPAAQRKADMARDRQEASEAPREWTLTLSRRELLLKLKDGEWTEGNLELAAPWTCVCCNQAGWVERKRLNSRVFYRISDEGLAQLSYKL